MNKEYFDLLKETFKNEFRSNGVKLKDVFVSPEKSYNDIAFVFDRNIQYVARWYKTTDNLIFSRIDKQDIPDNIDDVNFNEDEIDDTLFKTTTVEISQPDVYKITESISTDYKKYLKQKTLIQRLISKIVNENK